VRNYRGNIIYFESCDQRMLKYMALIIWKDRLSSEEINRRK